MTSRRGFTLIEIVVVLLVMGLAAAVVTPALITPRDNAGEPLRAAIDAARHAAIRRAEAVTLEVDATGKWTLRSDRSLDDAPILSDSVPAPQSALRLHVSPLGTCVMEADPRAPGRAANWDALRCADATEAPR